MFKYAGIVDILQQVRPPPLF